MLFAFNLSGRSHPGSLIQAKRSTAVWFQRIKTQIAVEISRREIRPTKTGHGPEYVPLA